MGWVVLTASLFITHTESPPTLQPNLQAGKPVEYGVNYAGIRFLKERGVLTEAQAEELEGGAVPAPFKPAMAAPKLS